MFFSYFRLKTGFDIGENLHEISKPVFWEKIRKIIQNVISWSAEIITQHAKHYYRRLLLGAHLHHNLFITQLLGSIA